MAKYIFPAIFTKDEEWYSIGFPDVPNCFTQGENLQDGLEMAEDALCLTLYHMEQDGKQIPEPTNIKLIDVPADAFVTLISCDTYDYAKFYKNKTVKKTLTIPEWLNEIAVKENVNFSNTLQNALMEQLHISK